MAGDRDRPTDHATPSVKKAAVLRCGLASNEKLRMGLFNAMTVRQLLLNCTNKSSAVAEMGHRDTAKWAEKWGGLLCPFRGRMSWVPNVAWAEAYLRTK